MAPLNSTDDPVVQLLTEIQALSAIKMPDIDSSSGTIQTGDGLGDFKHNWRTVMPRFNGALAEMISKVDERRANILQLATAICSTDPQLTDPVASIIRVTDEYREQLRKVYVLAEDATTLEAGIKFVLEAASVRLQANDRAAQLVASAINLMLYAAVKRFAQGSAAQ
ncbi:hypothetical protein [Tsukamurella sp. NPDC003166]|uniref:hypothetical protein n=1 Tax=Tsukamurella sp. NPDC003166 TaxID=3154444 RepID=UPI00339E7448